MRQSLKQKLQEKQEAIDKLRGWLRPGQTLYYSIEHVSRSGMQRIVRIKSIEPSKEPGQPVVILDLSWNLAKACGYSYRDGSGASGIVVGGCGFHAGFDCIYNLAAALYPAGFGCIGEGCPSNDHSNGDRDYTPHYDGTPRNSEEVGKDLVPYRHYHKDPGYAFKYASI